MGELSLDGSVRHVSGVLPMAYMAREQGYKTLYVPAGDAAEASLITTLVLFSFFSGVALLMYSSKELQGPDILIEKSLQRVTQRQRLPFGPAAHIQPFDAFTGVVHFVVPWGHRGRFKSHRVGLVYYEGSVMAVAEIAAKQRNQVMEMLTMATGLPEYQPPGN